MTENVKGAPVDRAILVEDTAAVEMVKIIKLPSSMRAVLIQEQLDHFWLDYTLPVTTSALPTSLL